MHSPTPTDLTITPRNIAFGRKEQRSRWWLGGDPVATAFNNAMSITFPQGEAFFIEAVRRYRDEVPEPLKSQINAFVKQEVFHTREHVAFNRQVVDAGYDTEKMDEWVRDRLTLSRAQPPLIQLTITAALEHFTAIFANSMLSHPDSFAGAEPEARRMWSWHAIEEIEHKAVAFDTFLHASRHLPGRKRYLLRALIMLNVSKNFVRGRTRDTLDLLRQDGITGWKAVSGVAWYLLGKPGALRRVFPQWLSWFRPGFHPWDHDDRALIAKAEAEFGLETPELAKAA